jgi:hypothetical protein
LKNKYDLDTDLDKIVKKMNKYLLQNLSKPLKYFDVEENQHYLVYSTYNITKENLEKKIMKYYRTTLLNVFDIMEKKHGVEIVSCYIYQEDPHPNNFPKNKLIDYLNISKNITSYKPTTYLTRIINDIGKKNFIVKFKQDNKTKIIKATPKFKYFSEDKTYKKNITVDSECLYWLQPMLFYLEKEIHNHIWRNNNASEKYNILPFLKRVFAENIKSCDCDDLKVEIHKHVRSYNLYNAVIESEKIKQTPASMFDDVSQASIEIAINTYSEQSILSAIRQKDRNINSFFYYTIYNRFQVNLEKEISKEFVLLEQIEKYLCSDEFKNEFRIFLKEKINGLYEKFQHKIEKIVSLDKEFSLNPNMTITDIITIFSFLADNRDELKTTLEFFDVLK